MSVTHYLITDSDAEEVERLTGIRGHNTSLGVLIEKPPSLHDFAVAMEQFREAINPTPRCTCGRGSFALIHNRGCPLEVAVT